MAIFIDSADSEEARLAGSLGWVAGVTTNPTLLAAVQEAPEFVLAKLAALPMRPVFYQLQQLTMEAMLLEAGMAEDIIGSGLVLKIPPTPLGYRFVALHHTEYPTCVTAVFSSAQVAVAAAAGAAYIAIYVNRATRLLGDGLALVRSAAEVLAGTQTEILAASLKSPKEASSALRMGAQHITAPLEILTAMMGHELSTQAVKRFDEEGAGISLPVLESEGHLHDRDAAAEGELE
ncbi:MAG: hypothetical protein JXA97_00035 [Anaerolineales bacterium]|nr:hypothetical protein [Anaerolineales bacterium]